MAFVAADWSITRSSKNIRYIGDAHGGASPSYATVIELHRALQDFADDSVDSGDDELSIIDETPSDRGGVDTNITLLNGYNIDQTASEHLYDGSITQSGGDVIYDGIQVFGNSTTIQVIQNGARLTNDFWNESAMVAVTADAASNTSHRFLILVRTGGSDIDGRRLIGTQRELGTLYTEFVIGGGTNRGNNVLALNANDDINNNTAAGTIATWTDIVNNDEGYNLIDADGDTTGEPYYSNWDLGSRTKNQFYERAKWIQREGSSETIYGLNGDIFRGITHEIPIDGPTGTFQEPEAVSWPGGTGQLLAIDSTTAGTTMWIQLLSGVAPSDNDTITGGTSSATADTNGSFTTRVVPAAFVGVSTGSAIIGAFGLGIEAADLTNNDQVTDLTGTVNQPPNNVTFTQSNLVVGDAVLVGPEDGSGGLDVDQLSLNTTLSGAAETAVVVTTTIPSDTPSSGTIRVQNDAGRYVRVPYTSFSGSTFTIPATDFSTENATAGNNTFISYIDKTAAATSEAVTWVYASDRTVFIRVRNATAQIKTFESTAVVGSGGGSSTTSRVSDA
jgi:hypothetical protein